MSSEAPPHAAGSRPGRPPFALRGNALRPVAAFCLLTALLLGLPAAAAASSDARVLSAARVRLSCEPETATKAWQQFAAACIGDVQTFLGGEPADPVPALRIRFGERPPTENRQPDVFALAFAPDDTMEAVTQRLVAALLLREFTGPGDANPPVMRSLPWLAAALTNRILFGNRERYGRLVPDYEPARFAFQRGCFPEVARLIEAPVPAEQTVPYRLYALHCDILALCLAESTDLGVFRRLLELDARGRPPVESLTFAMGDALAPGETLQAWYARTAVDLSRQGRRPSDTESTADRFEEVVSLPVVAPGEHDFRGSRQPLEEVDGSLEKLRADKEAQGRLQRDLFELLKDAPSLLQRPVAEYADACRELGAGHTRAARNGMRKARKAFAVALERQRRLDAYLDEQERRFVPAEKRFALPLAVVQRYSQSRRQLDPELHRYLDTVSR